MRQHHRRVAALAATVLALPATALAGTGTGHSGWEWSDPAPQGQSLAAVAFAGGTGYAAGDDGTLLRSTDAGLTWAALAPRTTSPLSELSVPSADVVAAGGACALRISGDAGVTLTRIALSGSERLCGAQLAAASFLNAREGLIVLSDGSVLATADGGRTLARRTSLPTAAGPEAVDVQMLSTTTAVAVAGRVIYRTTDGGGSWTVGLDLSGSGNGTLYDVTFPTPLVGYAVHDAGIVKTTDGGASWAPIARADGALLPLRRIACASETTCLATIQGSNQLLRMDGGGTGTAVVAPSDTALRGVAFASATRAVAVGDEGGIVVSDDAGLTWRRISTRLGVTLLGLEAEPFGSAFASGPSGNLLRTDDGATWRSVFVPAAGVVRSVSFRDRDRGYALDDTGTVLRTANGGASWDILDPGTGDAPHSVVTLPGARVVLVGRRTARRSTDGGATFATRPLPLPRRATVTRAARGGGGIVAWGRTRLLVTRDGLRWTALPLPSVRGVRVGLREAACPTAGTCWIVTTGGRIFRTANAGRRWTDVTAGAGSPRVTALAATGARRAYLALALPFGGDTGLGWVLATEDGGATWAPQRVSNARLLAVTAGAAGDYALDEAGHILVTRTGGRTATPARLTLSAAPRVVRRPTTVAVQGRLVPALGGEEVVVTTTTGRVLRATVASNGRFTVPVRVAATTGVVAQWGGDGVRSSAGSAVLTIRRR